MENSFSGIICFSDRTRAVNVIRSRRGNAAANPRLFLEQHDRSLIGKVENLSCNRCNLTAGAKFYFVAHASARPAHAFHIDRRFRDSIFAPTPMYVRTKNVLR